MKNSQLRISGTSHWKNLIPLPSRNRVSFNLQAITFLRVMIGEPESTGMIAKWGEMSIRVKTGQVACPGTPQIEVQ
jgi:hypothetical protein